MKGGSRGSSTRRSPRRAESRLAGSRSDSRTLPSTGSTAATWRAPGETADFLATEVGHRPELLPELREVALGEWEGLKREEIIARYPAEWERWAAHPSWDIVPGGEGSEAFEGRVGAAIEGLIARHPTGRVLVVTHGGVIQVALLRVVGRSSNGLFPFTIENTSITVLQGTPDRLLVGRVNDTCHLS